MPLLDHFHPPLRPGHHWQAFHGGWAHEMRRHLNLKVLPPGFVAEATVEVGGPEVDVATLEEVERRDANGATGGVAVEAWAPPKTTTVMPAVFPDEIEVQVYSMSGGATLVAAVELVSPANKDRPETRRAFAAKCAAYLQQGIGLVVVDVVTERHANMHDELIALLEQQVEFRFSGNSLLYTVAYRPARRKQGDQIDLWMTPLTIGQPLPTMPLALRGGPTLPLDLETTYSETRAGSRL